jgi:hypothetical protein
MTYFMQKKSAIMYFSALFVVVLFSGCAALQDSAENEQEFSSNNVEAVDVNRSAWKTYRNADYRFSFQYPGEHDLYVGDQEPCWGVDIELSGPGICLLDARLDGDLLAWYNAREHSDDVSVTQEVKPITWKGKEALEVVQVERQNKLYILKDTNGAVFAVSNPDWNDNINSAMVDSMIFE